MPDAGERREARRFLMSLPLRVLPRDAHAAELRAHTRDVSYRGLYFSSEGQFEVGGEFEFILTLPQHLSQAGYVDIRCRGEVVRVESSNNGRVGIAARIQRYEFVPVAATAA